ncbi:MAG: hypothetical protein HUJ27_00285 [Rhodobacteraceae bacterium]|nr:hypothetical protein [Paracoccaceae bacterium]
MIRPELMQSIRRCREALIGALIAGLGIFWAVASYGILQIVGMSLTIVGALVVFAGIQRMRFRTGGDGPGIVQVVEGQITYFGPLDGGSVSVDAIERIELEPKSVPSPEWILIEANTPPLHIPINASGSEVLFDVFARLEGLDTQRMLNDLHSGHGERILIWTSEKKRVH